MKYFYAILFLCVAQVLCAHSDCTNCGLYFIENKGQWENKIHYKSEFASGAIFFETDRATFALCNAEQKRKVLHHANRPADEVGDASASSATQNEQVPFHAYQMIFENASSQTKMQADEVLLEYFNYFLGSDKSKWKGHCQAFRKVIYRNLYDGIDAEYYSQEVGLKYDLYVKPNADISQIAIRYEGLENLKIDKKGNLVLVSSIGDIIEQKPYAYQIINGKKQEVGCAFVLDEETKTIRFSAKNYDENYTLVIDPHLVFATYSGSTSDNFGYTATYDKYGNAYAAGSTFGTGYPTTLGAYQVNYIGGPTITSAPGNSVYMNDDIGITKYNPTGTARIYSTYLGGYGADLPHSLVVNENDELFVFGTTASQNFPITVGAHGSTFQGGTNIGGFYGLSVAYNTGSDIIISRFSANGTQLLASTFLGGTANDGLNYNNPFTPTAQGTTRHNYADEVRGEIDIAPDGNIVIATTTRSQNYPQTDTIFTASTGTDADACITKLTPMLDSVIWSVKFGGANDDAAYSVAFGRDSSIYVVGGTASPDFPVPGIGRQKIYGGGLTDGWIYHIGKDADTIYATSFQGFFRYDQIYFVELNRNGDVFVFGQCDSSQTNFIFNAAYNKPNGGQFITKFTNDLTNWDWSTSFGRGVGVADISPTAFLVDICNSIYASGWGSPNVNSYAGWANVLGTSGLDVTPGTYQSTTDNHDFYLMVLRDDASALQYATFIGGNGEADHVDGGTSRFDRKGVVYQSVCASCGATSNFPTFPANCVSPTNQSPNCNNLVFKFDLDLPAVIADFGVRGCSRVNVPFDNLSNLVSGSTTYHWNFGDGDTSNLANPTHTYAEPGTYQVTLRLNDPLSCNITDSITKTVIINISQSDTLPTVSVCLNDSVQIGIAPSIDPNATYTWIPSSALSNPNVSNPFSSTNTNTLYTLYYSHDYCVDTLKQRVIVFSDSINTTGGAVLCPNDTLMLSATHINAANTVTYSWQPINLIASGANTANPTVLPTTDTTFYVTATDQNGCVYYDSVFVQVASSLGDVSVFAEPDTITFGDTSQITSIYDSSIIDFLWDTDVSLSNLNIPNPLAFPRETRIFTLTATDTNGCKLKRSTMVVVLRTPCSDRGLFVPNAFTPNGDGENDVWYVRGYEIQKVTIAVYDRWGQKMFESNSLNDGWDGTFNGKPLDPSVFGYYIEGYCVNNEKFSVKGNVTLLK